VLDRLPRELSGGQRQRVAMGRAIVRQPAVFLFDEPLSNLDAALRTQLRVELKQLHQRLGATMVYVTHDQVEAMTLADRICLLNDGCIEQVGTPQELYENPVNRFVAGFMGSPAMGFLEHVEEGVVLGIRPNHVTLVPAGQGTYAAHIEMVERLGFESLVHLRVGADRLVARVEGDPPEKGPVGVNLEKVLRFDGNGGRRR